MAKVGQTGDEGRQFRIVDDLAGHPRRRRCYGRHGGGGSGGGLGWDGGGAPALFDFPYHLVQRIRRSVGGHGLLAHVLFDF